jgi:hypothetical protein
VVGEIQNTEDESEFFSSKRMKEENKKKLTGKSVHKKNLPNKEI